MADSRMQPIFPAWKGIGNRIQVMETNFQELNKQGRNLEGWQISLDNKFEQRFDSMEKDFKMMEHKIDKRMERIDKRFDSIDARFDHIDKRFDSIEFGISELVAMATEWIQKRNGAKSVK